MGSSPDRLASLVARTRWSEARKVAKQTRQHVLDALDEAYPAEQYVRDLVALTKSKDPRVRARGLELISKIRGDQAADEGARQVRTRFASFLSGIEGLPAKAQGGDGREDGAGHDETEAD